MNYRLWLVVICTTTAACSDPTSQANANKSAQSPATSAAPAQHSTQTGTSDSAIAAARIYIDPDTGQARAPTAAELAAEATQRKQVNAASSASRAGVTVTPLPNGITQYDLGDAARVDETACLQPNGSLGECTAQQKQELRATQQQHE